MVSAPRMASSRDDKTGGLKKTNGALVEPLERLCAKCRVQLSDMSKISQSAPLLSRVSTTSVPTIDVRAPSFSLVIGAKILYHRISVWAIMATFVCLVD